MISKRLNTLVIGGGGYIGSHLVPLLCDSGRNVTVLGRNSYPTYELPNKAKYITGDFGKRNLINELLKAQDEVIHLAYATVPNTSFENPLADLLENLPPTIQLFSEAADIGVKLILVSSGGTVYGEAIESPILETHNTKPISPYGVTKITLENYANLYAATHGLNFICLRPANAYGVGQRPFIGQGFISTAIASVIKGIPINIFGEFGTIRDYIYVGDLAQGIVSALNYGHPSETYNIGTGIGYSNLEVVNLFKSIIKNLNDKILVTNLPERPFDVKSNVLNSRKLQEHTGWVQMVELENGLMQTYEWLKNFNF
jgi:UDP-glucose 4-epimerase